MCIHARICTLREICLYFVRFLFSRRARTFSASMSRKKRTVKRDKRTFDAYIIITLMVPTRCHRCLTTVHTHIIIKIFNVYFSKTYIHTHTRDVSPELNLIRSRGRKIIMGGAGRKSRFAGGGGSYTIRFVQEPKHNTLVIYSRWHDVEYVFDYYCRYYYEYSRFQRIAAYIYKIHTCFFFLRFFFFFYLLTRAREDVIFVRRSLSSAAFLFIISDYARVFLYS